MKLTKLKTIPNKQLGFSSIEYFIDGKFVSVLVIDVPGDNPEETAQGNRLERRRMAETILQYRRNGGKFLCVYAPDGINDPISFINLVKSNGLSLRHYGDTLFQRYNYGACPYTDFHGNTSDRDHAFCFRIFDDELLKEIKHEIRDIEVLDGHI